MTRPTPDPKRAARARLEAAARRATLAHRSSLPAPPRRSTASTSDDPLPRLALGLAGGALLALAATGAMRLRRLTAGDAT